MSHGTSYTTVAHSGHHYSADKAAGLLAAPQLPLDALVLDAGCGKAAFLRDLLASASTSIRLF
jgi:hypothetical protein